MTLSLLGIVLLGLLQQELDTKLQFWKTKQQEVVAKLSILRKNKKYPKEVQNYVAQYQKDAYKNVSDVMSFNYKQCILETNRNHDNSLAIALSGRWQKKSAIHFTSSLTSKSIYVM